ncbi:MAG: trypsin-like peptidase domain-containing protein [Candidatus Peregrinibacteria bacterium]|nr:trypsin-like peptidase domain-containing protein [Candidatus Peregrinibacteria bacterium]
MDKNYGKNVLTGAVSGGVTALVIVGAFVGLSQPVQSPSTNNASDSKNIVQEVTSQEQLVINTVKKAKDSTVSIVITKDVPILEKYFSNPFGESSPFNVQIPQYRQNGTEKKEVGGGSGFIVSEDGYIITNRHVVSDETAEYTVIMNDAETKYDAKVIARDSLNDIAVIKIEEKGLPFLNFADSDILQAGQTAIAIGSPLLEFKNSVSVGVVSGLSRKITAGDGRGMSEKLEGIIQTDAAINPGNSGGPLLDLHGNVIGVNVAVASAENIGFSLPANTVKSIFDSVQKTGKIFRPFLGIRFIPITKAIKEANSLSVDYGVLVLRGEKPEELAVVPGSPADKAGLSENDIILEVDGVKLDDNVSLPNFIAKKNIGDSVEMKVLHKGEEKTITVKLEEKSDK